MLGFFLVASVILFLMQMLVGLWVAFLFPSIGWKMPALIGPLLLTVFICFTLVYTRTHYGTIASMAYYCAHIWMGLVFVFFSLVLVLAFMQLISGWLHLPVRELLKWVTLAAGVFITLSSLWGGFTSPSLRTLRVQIPGAPSVKAVIISDTHLGTGVSLARWQKALKRIQAQRPDIILVLGDLFEYGKNREQYARALAELNPPLGVYGVLGNHEYYVGYKNSVDFYKKAGIKLLENQVETLPNGLQIIGVNDIQTARVSAKQLDALLAQTDPAKPRILLSHQPLLTDIVAKHHIPLMLSGHTHNGQLFPFNLLVKLKYPHVYGWYNIRTPSRLYVTSGMFYWGIPLRFLSPAEIPVLQINGHD